MSRNLLKISTCTYVNVVNIDNIFNVVFFSQISIFFLEIKNTAFANDRLLIVHCTDGKVYFVKEQFPCCHYVYCHLFFSIIAHWRCGIIFISTYSGCLQNRTNSVVMFEVWNDIRKACKFSVFKCN